MSYSKSETRRKNKRKQFIAWCILWLIGLSIGIVIISGFIHLFCCTNALKVDATTNVSEESEIISLGEYKLTAYCACFDCCKKLPTDPSYGITASGVKAVQGVTVAADTRVLPFGTKIVIDGHEYTVQDRGGAIKGNKIDVYFDSHQKALEFGVQYKEVFVKG